MEGRFPLATNGAASVKPADLKPFQWEGDVSGTLVFVNGRYAPGLSGVGPLPAGVKVENLGQALVTSPGDVEPHLARVASERHAFAALNTAFVADGAFISIPASTVVAAPIHLLFLAAGEDGPSMAHPRALIVLGANSEVTIVESYGAVRAGRYFTNAVTEVVAGENATLNHYKVQRESPVSIHMAGMYLHAANDVNLSSHSISLGGSLVRNDIIAVLDGQGGTCTLNGLYFADGSRLVDNHTTIDHAKPHCDSREIYKGILADKAQAVFNGKIIVRPDAQKTDAKQTNKALLLSEDAQINTKPELEIFANDVKCTHGAAIGQMDDEAIFYLRTRGFSEPQARHILIRAFAGDVLNQMPLEPLRARLDHELLDSLPEWRT